MIRMDEDFQDNYDIVEMHINWDIFKALFDLVVIIVKRMDIELWLIMSINYDEEIGIILDGRNLIL